MPLVTPKDHTIIYPTKSIKFVWRFSLSWHCLVFITKYSFPHEDTWNGSLILSGILEVRICYKDDWQWSRRECVDKYDWCISNVHYSQIHFKSLNNRYQISIAWGVCTRFSKVTYNHFWFSKGGGGVWTPCLTPWRIGWLICFGHMMRRNHGYHQTSFKTRI